MNKTENGQRPGCGSSSEPTPQENRTTEASVVALLAAASEAIDAAYAPYSRYPVGAAVLAEDGRVYAGCNVENAVYPLTICAERTAIFKAVSAGARKILALAVVTNNGGAPCGSCRQVMREFGDGEMPVYIADRTGAYRVHTLDALLPYSFSGRDLDEACDGKRPSADVASGADRPS